MFVHVHVETFTATQTGHRLREVTCDQCRTSFAYDLARTATGRAYSAYGIAPMKSQARAEAHARKLLQKLLDRDVELVPCPTCRHVNCSAIRAFRKTRHTSLAKLALVFFLLGLLTAILFYFMSREFFHHRPDLAAPELLFTVAITLVIALFPLLLQATLRQRLDPNRPNPTGHPILPPGTPPALLRSPDGSFHPVPSVPLDTTSATLYAIYRPGQLVLEPLCCQCLAPSTTTYKPPLALSAGKNFLPVPLCHPCAKRLRNRTWLYFLLIAVPLSLFIAALAAVLVPGIDDIGRVILALVSGLALIVASLFAVTYATLPFRLKLIDPHRHIHRLWFQNPAYTALLIRRLAEADGHH